MVSRFGVMFFDDPDAWDEHADPFTGVVRFTIMMLRRKLGDPPVIETVPGTGYRIA
jgi:DNA-binding response OmpR family regulator